MSADVGDVRKQFPKPTAERQKMIAQWQEQQAAERELAVQVRDHMLLMIDSLLGARLFTSNHVSRMGLIHDMADEWERHHLPGDVKARERHGRYWLNHGGFENAQKCFKECLDVYRKTGASVDDVRRLTDLLDGAKQMRAKRDEVKAFMDTPEPAQDEPVFDSFDK